MKQRDMKDDLPKRLGNGGIAEAWLVQDQETARLAVSKRLICDEHFRPAIRLASQRAHALLQPLIPYRPKIQIPYEPFWGDEAIYEYIPGTPLNETVPQGLALEEKLYLVKRRLIQAVDAISELAGKGLVHCDIRPENMILTPDNEVFLIDPDFTLEAGDYRRKQFHGPVWFTAPEVLRGSPRSTSDLFSAGVSAWTLLGANLSILPSPVALSEERMEEGFHGAASKESLKKIRPVLEGEDPEFVRLLDGLTDPNPAHRPILSDCIASLREHVDESAYSLPM